MPIIIILLALLTAASAAALDAENNNFCYTIRACTTDEEWIRGYYDFCAAHPSHAGCNEHGVAHDDPANNNLCFTTRACTTDEEWIRGYYDFYEANPSLAGYAASSHQAASRPPEQSAASHKEVPAARASASVDATPHDRAPAATPQTIPTDETHPTAIPQPTPQRPPPVPCLAGCVIQPPDR